MNFDQVTPRLYVGSCPIENADVDRLKKEIGVTGVLNLQSDDDIAYWRIDWEKLETHYREAEIEVRHVPVQDFNPDSLRRGLPRCVEALAELMEEGRTVYVHCNAGINRSPTTVIAYLHWREGKGLEEATAHVLTRRSCQPYVDMIRLASEDMSSEDMA